MTTPSAWRSLHHCSPRSEKMQRAVDKLFTLLTKVCRQVKSVVVRRSCFRWVWITHFKRPRKSVSRLREWANQDSSGTTERADSRWLSTRDSKTRVSGRLWQKKYPKVEWSYRVSKRRNLSCSSRRRTTSTRSTTSSWTIIGTNKIGIFVKLMRKVSMRWKNWTDFKAQHSTQFQKEGTVLELTGKIQEPQNEVNCLNESRDFQDAESVRSGHSHVASQPVFFPPHPDPGGMLSRSLGMPSREEGPPSIWDTHGISGNVLKIQQRPLQHLIRRSHILGSLMYQNTHHHMWWAKAKHQFRIRDASQDRQPEIQSSLVREIFQRIMGQTNNECRFWIFILTNSPRQQHLVVGR